MELLNPDLEKNTTFVHPAYFIISGFIDIPDMKYYYVFLFFVYIVSVLGNTAVMGIICLDHTLRTPKYIAVFNLAFADLSTALIPKILDIFLFDNRYIVYEACLSYMFFVWFFVFVQSWALVIMAYDRFIAICFPLMYHSIVTKPAIVGMLAFTWVLLLSLLAFIVGLIGRLSFCGSVVIQSFFCDHGPTYRLACNDNSLNYAMAFVVLIVIFCFPPVLIALTYICISIALSRISSEKERIKAFKTCTSHLILVSVFFIPLLGTNIAVMTSYIHPNTRIINSALTHIIPPLLNPIIYSLKTKEVLSSIRRDTQREDLSL
uniref:G-protein coupled receptors family 1 profile domain-containing protein n=1 Tax=Monopterus albus TaxID=43700 RepID=A0A3Q3JL48_MONAL